MVQTPIYTIDLNFHSHRQAIASYMVKHSDGVVLVESGPGSTLEGLKLSLQTYGMTFKDVTHVLLTHIHLDHAGAAGWLAQQGAEVYVHPVGAPHMINPDKLLASAQRIYGDKMEMLWGEFLPVPKDRLKIVNDCEEIKISKLRFLALNTPGHADHHCAYIFKDICFTGDIGGVRIPDYRYINLPLVPPELHLEKWRQSIQRLQKMKIKCIAPTHFGVFDDPEWHLQAVINSLDSVSRWLENVMPVEPTIEELREKILRFLEYESRTAGISGAVLETYQISIPSWLSADGLQRYWRKYMMQT